MNKSALSHLRKDKVMAKLIKENELEKRRKTNLTSQYIFGEIIKTILGQQLSGKAADTIIERFKDIYGGELPGVDRLLKTKDQEIRNCGTSWSKVSYIKNVASAIVDGKLDLKKLSQMDDEEVGSNLLIIVGIGDWTTEMVLMSTLRREDVFSTGDTGLQNAMYKHYGVKKGDSKRMLKIAENWRPYRSLACRYLWKSLDNR